ncbi:holliday junction resolvase, putative [Heliomicrobium modesticaldum Ice1]|uniref:Putative pre-16S rRNA nuclease n=1 Tax=Heliobacterium modesticaldum (strain ATCC 51547 / Ice1) TaxID=498761 RepID=YQGF_HELMI|nr:Holliday junction resolvase RuvX [Heliomicrobium modesticaldum]B0TFZ0.1 RecName: Full=Putative pre-16S rRNA nuclease [Heliomicrobium modesticaldum Ice1]ABZ83147.1 holliday junction resolvase, putative [Heliomicrobium modesticaldum Ice1]
MRIMGLDVGDKTIGVAVSDLMGWTAQGVATIRRSRLAADLEHLRELVKTYEVERIVCGLPRNMNGTYGPRAEGIRKFGSLVEKKLNIPVDYWDERLTTVAAQKTLIAGDLSRAKRKQVVDKLAAVLILQNYMDAKAHLAAKEQSKETSE